MYVSTLPDGRLAIIRILGLDKDGAKLAKTLYELSRDGSDMTTHFDHSVHTRDAIAAGIPGHVPLICRGCKASSLPSENADRGMSPTFRNAWEDTGRSIQVNMPKARVIHMNRIREVRDAELTKLDIPFMRAVESTDIPEQQRIAVQKQILRDIPQTFDLSPHDSPEALKAAWPAGLPQFVK